MKATFIIILMGTLTFLGGKVHAQDLDESLVKIVPTETPGILKVIYGSETLGPLKVSFITSRGGVVDSDKIEVGSYPTGISKRYDVKNISDHNFWVEVSSPQMSVTYRISPSGNGGFTTSLEKSTYYQAIVRKN